MVLITTKPTDRPEFEMVVEGRQGRRLPVRADSGGRLVTVGVGDEDTVSGVTASITGTADTEVIAAPGSGRRLVITDVIVSNGHASTDTYVNLKDGTTSVLSVYCAADGGGFTIALRTPLRLAENTALNAANETTASDTRVFASGYKVDMTP